MSIIKIDRREYTLTLKYMSMAVEGLEIYRRVIIYDLVERERQRFLTNASKLQICVKVDRMASSAL